MKFAICNEIFRDWKLADVFEKAAGYGYQAIEIAPFTLAERVTDIPAEERVRIRQLAQSHGIDISGIHWVLVKPEGLHISHTDPEIRRQTSQYFCDLVDFCADIGGTTMVVGSPKQRNIMPGVTPDQAWDWARATFAVPVERAAARGVTICLEPLAPAETNFLNTAEETIEFVRSFNQNSFKIILDVKAMCSESLPIPDIIRQSWPHFAYFHANDRNLKGPGFGDVDYKPIVQALREVGYDGYVSVEVFRFEEGPEVIARQSLQYLQSVFGLVK
jgi:sugar phosphate isomerase/epimerase